MISVQGLKKQYDGVRAVDDISFEIKRGEIVGFLGPNGAGKTTTMKILTCYIGATEGRASIAGIDVEKNSLEVRRKIGYLPENAPVYMDMNVSSYLKFVAEIREIENKKLAVTFYEITETCGLKSVLRRPISELSKGYRQRVGLAQAMLHNPDVLILDEPTSGLDPNQIVEIRELIKRIGQEKTVILSTHILPEVSATCDRAIIINHGKIVAEGTLDELVAGTQVVVTAKIRGDKSSIEEKLNNFDGAENIRFTAEDSGVHTVQINPVKGQKITEDIFKISAESGWTLSELRSEGASLESVFAELTRSGK